MSYDIYLNDPVTGQPIELQDPHMMTGGTYAIGGTRELWLNVTYNYASYYYEATEGDERFAHQEKRRDEFVNEYGIRGIYGKSGAESIPMLTDMISRIENKYKTSSGEWITTVREKRRVHGADGKVYEDALDLIFKGIKFTEEKYEVEISEGPNPNYWEATAGNAIKPLHQLIAMARLRPDGIWDGD